MLRNKNGCRCFNNKHPVKIIKLSKDNFISKITRNALELKDLIPSELLSVYEIETSSILDDIEENGLLTPISLSKEGIPLDS